ncbi:MAG: site-specific integrase [Actinomycetota bacterium]|nr:site-specific integrase [Actinomycetota bacterium]
MTNRIQRAGVEDRWRKKVKDERGNTVEVPSAVDGKVTRWRARYVDHAGREYTRHFERKIDAQNWLKTVTASLVRGDHVTPKTARTTVGEWCDTWLDGYRTRRKSTVRQAEVHIKLIKEHFGGLPLAAVKPSDVKSWTAKLKQDGRAASYVYALHGRLAQIYSDAVHDGVVPRSPCSRRTSPGAGQQRAYVATTMQVWKLHDVMAPGMRAAVLLGAHAGLRLAEVAALRAGDVDFIRGVITPAIQWPDQVLKSDTSRTPIPIPGEMTLELSAALAANGGRILVANEMGEPAGPWAIERAMRAARGQVQGLPAGFRFHDLRHYFASLLISSGLDVKTVQARMRHASAKTTLDTYSHLWPDRDEPSRAAVATVYGQREQSPAESLRNRS